MNTRCYFTTFSGFILQISHIVRIKPASWLRHFLGIHVHRARSEARRYPIWEQEAFARNLLEAYVKEKGAMPKRAATPFLSQKEAEEQEEWGPNAQSSHRPPVDTEKAKKEKAAAEKATKDLKAFDEKQGVSKSLSAAKAKATESEKPLVIVYTDPGTT